MQEQLTKPGTCAEMIPELDVVLLEQKRVQVHVDLFVVLDVFKLLGLILGVVALDELFPDGGHV